MASTHAAPQRLGLLTDKQGNIDLAVPVRGEVGNPDKAGASNERVETGRFSAWKTRAGRP